MNEYEAFANIPTKRSDCLCCIPTLALTLWIALSFNLKGPRCYVQQFYVPALDLSLNTSNATAVNPSLFFDIALKNIMNDHSVRYDDVNLTFSYGGASAASYVVPGFYQGKGKTARRREVVEARGFPWEEAVRVVSNGSKVVFRVDLAARPRFRFWFWYSKRKGVRIGANVEVDGSGMKVGKGHIRLKSLGGSKPRVGVFLMFLCLLLTTCLFY